MWMARPNALAEKMEGSIMVNHPNRRKAIYATKDCDNGHISRDATILKFATEAEARAYLIQGYDPSEWDLRRLKSAPVTTATAG